MSLTTDVATTFPAHDPAGWRQLPGSFTPLDPARVAALMAKEWERYAKTTPGSADHAARSIEDLAAGCDQQLPVLGSVPDGREVRHAARRSPTSTTARCSTCRWASARCSSATSTPRWSPRSTSPWTTRHAVRHPVADLDRGRREVQGALRARPAAVHQLRHRVDDVRGAHGARLHRPEGHHQDRGRLPRRLRRPAGVGQAGCRRGRPRGQPDPAVPFEVEAGIVHVVPYNDLGRMRSMLAAHGDESPAWSWSRCSRTSASCCPTPATSPASAPCATRTACC